MLGKEDKERLLISLHILWHRIDRKKERKKEKSGVLTMLILYSSSFVSKKK
jgi:hypothetical protein